MPHHPGSQRPSAQAEVLAEVNAQTGAHYQWQRQRQLNGGEQGGAHLVIDDGRSLVLKWEPAGWKADQLRGAFTAVVHATAGGWAAPRWLICGTLPGGGAFVLQEHAAGTAMTRLDVVSAQAVLAANQTQSGLAFPGAHDDSHQLEAVLAGDDGWKADVARFTPAGALLVQHGDEVVARAGQVTIPGGDVVHGDYSSSNILLSDDGDSATATLVDCQTVGKGSRVRDLADLYRQGHVYSGAGGAGLDLIRAAAGDVAGPAVFARCVVAVTHNNLAWWVEHKPAVEFNQACDRLHGLFSGLVREWW